MKSTTKVTKRQEQVLGYIKAYIASNKYPPTIREVGDHLGISVKGAYDHIRALAKKGVIRCDNHRSRAIEVVEEERSSESAVVEVPLLGTVAAGRPLLVEENYEGTVAVPAQLLRRRRYFALHVQGDSMVGAGIMDGDIAVISQQPTAENGDIVVAMVDDAVTLKRFYRETNRVQLKSENPAYPPIYTQDVRILGKLAHLMRAYD